MWKSVVAATAALAIAGSSIVYAQQRFGEDGYGDGSRFQHRHHHMSAEDRAAFVDARIAALKAGLELTADQTKNWPAFEQALREMAKLRAERRAARVSRIRARRRRRSTGWHSALTTWPRQAPSSSASPTPANRSI
jgi:hypothetical protein